MASKSGSKSGASASGSGGANLQDLLHGAQASGVLTQAALNSINVVDLGDAFDDMGVDIEAIDSNEVFLIVGCVDNSYSIQQHNNTNAVIKGYNGYLDSLDDSESTADFLIATFYVNRGLMQTYTPLKQAWRLNDVNYVPDGGTPLYDQAITLGAFAGAKYQEITATGASCRGVLFFLGDGKDEGSRAKAKQAADVLTPLQGQERFQVIAMGVQDKPIDKGGTDFYQVYGAMGVRRNLILPVSADPSSLRRAFGVMSRATKHASQGGSLSGGLGGFGTAGDPAAGTP